jgi:hypothetical protein
VLVTSRPAVADLRGALKCAAQASARSAAEHVHTAAHPARPPGHSLARGQPRSRRKSFPLQAAPDLQGAGAAGSCQEEQDARRHEARRVEVRLLLVPATMCGWQVRRAARALAAQAASQVGRAPGHEPLRAMLKWGTRGRLGRRRGWPVVPVLGTPWQDTVSAERTGWRERAAYLDGSVAFAVDYQTCRGCGLGWVEQPYTESQYQRCGLAAAGLAALRCEQPGLEWHTLGGHLPDSEAFWSAVRAGVAGGYRRREMCPHRGNG